LQEATSDLVEFVAYREKVDDEEQVFLREGDVLVTSTRFAVGPTTYAISSINSVKFTEVPPDRSLQGCLGAIALGLFLVAISVLAMSPSTGIPCFLILTVVAIFITVVISKDKPSYQTIITTSSGELQALTGNDRGFIRRVVNAIEQAIISRG
jgi:hypothetical protein